jgi:hypothetical protein
MWTIEVHTGYAESPNENYGWKLYSFNRKHASYKPLDSFTYCVQDRLGKGEAYWVSYYEHGNCWWGIAGSKTPAGVEFTWDGVQIGGVLVWEEDEAAPGPESAAAFLQEYTDWSNGESFCFVILDEDNMVIDSCDGLIGSSWAAQHIADSIPPEQDFRVTGEAWYLEKLIRDKVRNPPGRVGLA